MRPREGLCHLYEFVAVRRRYARLEDLGAAVNANLDGAALLADDDRHEQQYHSHRGA